MRKTKKFLLYIAVTIYTFLMLWLLFGQRIVRWSDGYNFALLSKNINLIPFHTIAEFLADLRGGNSSSAIINLFGNVIMFVPLGFFIPILFEKVNQFHRTMIWSAVTIICIEILQFTTLLGSLDIDDFLLNLVGAITGYGIFMLLHPNKG